MTYTCLDLFAGIGGFSRAFAAHPEWEVLTLDITDQFERAVDVPADPYGIETVTVKTEVQLSHDFVMDFEAFSPVDLPADRTIDLVLASPPCTTFSLINIGHHRHDANGHPKTETAARHERLLFHLHNVIQDIDPPFWVVENPRGKMRTLEPFGRPTATVTFCQYGANRRKPTDLWGVHPPGFEYRQCPNGADCHEAAPRNSQTGTQGMATSTDRAAIPEGLSAELCRATTAALNGEATTGFDTTHQQSTTSYVSYCSACGRRRQPDEAQCGACGRWLRRHRGRGITRCPDGHYTQFPTTDANCKWCTLTETPPDDYGYPNWRDHPLCECAAPPTTVRTVGRQTFAVPANFTELPTQTTSEIVATDDYPVEHVYTESAYRCVACERVFCAARQRTTEHRPAEAPSPYPRQPRPDTATQNHTLDSFTN